MVATRVRLNRDDWNNVECMTTANSRSARLTGNAAAGNAYNVADMASLLQAVRNAGANNVVILGALSWQCARCTRATSSQWVASVNNISTLASRLNGLSIAAVAASSHSYDLTKPPAARG